jgi:hypothetical protein
MNRNKKILDVGVANVATSFAGFFLGCIYTEHWILGIGFGKEVNSFCPGWDDGFRY